jgi:phage major head subunit gpT-like protein
MDQYPGITSKGVIGMFYAALRQDLGMTWIPRIAMPFDSNQETETYKWLGMVPAMREWVGGRQAKGLRENGISITNKKYEATLEVNVDDLRRDKTGQLRVRIAEQARRANAHWASLLSTLILNGPSALCYDGQYFFDTDHSEGSSGSQSNQISPDISALPCAVHGTTTTPSREEAVQSILQGVSAILGFLDDQAEPMNEEAAQFVVMAAPQNPLYLCLQAAIVLDNLAAGVANIIPSSGFNISIVPNARLSTWTDRFAIFRTDAQVKPFIKQEELPIVMSAKAEGSEFEFDSDKHQYGIKASRNVGYGYWQEACEVILV